MINLIGPDRKKQLLAARRNSIWIRYGFLLTSALVTILLILGGTAFFFYGQKQSQDEALRANQKKQFTTEYRKRETEVTEFRKKLNTAKSIFDAETYYSAIILEVAKTMPKNTILSTISFDSSTFQSQQTLTFQSKAVSDALALKTAFEKNPPLSSKVHFSVVEKIDPEGLTGQSAKYPVSITMSMELKKPDNSVDSSSNKSKATGN
ncbi:MAG: hypothetical protein AAB395_04325 [Patescibacteria group bacterium]